MEEVEDPEALLRSKDLQGLVKETNRRRKAGVRNKKKRAHKKKSAHKRKKSKNIRKTIKSIKKKVKKAKKKLIRKNNKKKHMKYAIKKVKKNTKKKKTNKKDLVKQKLNGSIRKRRAVTRTPMIPRLSLPQKEPITLLTAKTTTSNQIVTLPRLPPPQALKIPLPPQDVRRGRRSSGVGSFSFAAIQEWRKKWGAKDETSPAPNPTLKKGSRKRQKKKQEKKKQEKKKSRKRGNSLARGRVVSPGKQESSKEKVSSFLTAVVEKYSSVPGVCTSARCVY